MDLVLVNSDRETSDCQEMLKTIDIEMNSRKYSKTSLSNYNLSGIKCIKI